MRFNWLHYLDLASELYEQARGSGHGDANWRSSISRSYYATFHKTRQQLKDKWGITIAEASHAHQQVQQELKQKNQNTIAYNLRHMRINRNNADYKDKCENLEKIARANIRRAKQVLSELSSL